MRKRRIGVVGALGLAMAVAIPGTALASGTQNVEAGFTPEKNANVTFPAPSANLSDQFSKNGTIRFHLFLSNIVGQPPALQTVDIHAPEELKFNTKGLARCDPAIIEGTTPEDARAACPDAQIGTGSATALGIPQPGGVTLFNGTEQNGNPTTLFHTFTANVPIVLVAEMQDSPLQGYGTLFHTPVSTTVGGGVPPGIVITDTDFTNSKTYKDKKILKKAKKAKKKGNTKKYKKLKKKAKKSWVQAECTDGTLTTQVDFIHAPPEPTQSPTAEQPCTS
ncbi:MAG TPA: hypothetical protein VE401_06345 [Solirubrobacterales bacterium]|nr:hypothetical protein [Solirubrobacterales bacterium]HZA89837.1 hypothetical protein [Solirubrobacterales bacterium]